MSGKSHPLVTSAFTLVELLVVIGLIGVLIALLLPAVQASRESSRRVVCQNNLRQVSLGVQNHLDTHKHYPNGGWGHKWAGVPTRGNGRNQPGGWVYNTLPFLELGNIHRLGGDPQSPNAEESYTRRLSTPICLFYCPTRRPCTTYQTSSRWEYLSKPLPVGSISSTARSDYAINGGPIVYTSWPGPESIMAGEDPNYRWPRPPRNFSGISYLRTAATDRQILDGTSNTFLLGEKFIDPAHYSDGESLGDNETLYSGYATDLHRYTKENSLPLQDTSRPLEVKGYTLFGSAHFDALHMAFCDGSVKALAYSIDAMTYYSLGSRDDGELMSR